MSFIYDLLTVTKKHFFKKMLYLSSSEILENVEEKVKHNLLIV